MKSRQNKNDKCADMCYIVLARDKSFNNDFANNIDCDQRKIRFSHTYTHTNSWPYKVTGKSGKKIPGYINFTLQI